MMCSVRCSCGDRGVVWCGVLWWWSWQQWCDAMYGRGRQAPQAIERLNSTASGRELQPAIVCLQAVYGCAQLLGEVWWLERSVVVPSRPVCSDIRLHALRCSRTNISRLMFITVVSSGRAHVEPFYCVRDRQCDGCVSRRSRLVTSLVDPIATLFLALFEFVLPDIGVEQCSVLQVSVCDPVERRAAAAQQFVRKRQSEWIDFIASVALRPSLFHQP